jgi:hypothetical protein
MAMASSRPISANPRFLRTRFIHLQRPPFHIASMQLANGPFGVLLRPDLYESESSRASSFSIADHSRRRHLKSLAAEQLLQPVIGHFGWEVPDIQFRHLLLFH